MDIPRQREWLAVSELSRDIVKIAMEGFCGTMSPAEFVEHFWVGRAVCIATLSGQKVTAARLAKLLGMKRNKVVRKLGYLVGRGFIVKDGQHYTVAVGIYASGNDTLNKSIKLIIEAANRLTLCPK
jgi:hypothetical protein